VLGLAIHLEKLMKYRTILLFGAPGAGKGTQGKILGTIPQFFHCACGDVFRNLRTDNELGRIFVEYSSRGQLVPDEATVRLWRHSIQGNIAAGGFCPERDTLVLDGIPRNVQQAGMLQEAIEVHAVINLVCPDLNRLVERLQRRALHENRLDDANLDTIRSRLETYERQTRPVLDFYGPKLIHSVDAMQTPVCVARQILDILISLSPSS
jgi:adenylate kinase